MITLFTRNGFPGRMQTKQTSFMTNVTRRSFSHDFHLQGTNVFTVEIMHISGGLDSEESNAAAWEAGRGAVAGAAKV